MIHDKVLADNIIRFLKTNIFSIAVTYSFQMFQSLLFKVIAYLPEEMQESLRKSTNTTTNTTTTTSIKRKAEVEEEQRCVKNKI